MKPKVLVISRSSWDDTNNTGNTLSNIFQNWESTSIANLYCRDSLPNNNICENYFKITERLLIKKLFLGKGSTGIRIEGSAHKIKNNTKYKDKVYIKKEKKFYDFFRNNRWHIFLWLRELLWKTGLWKDENLNNFLLDFNPDIIYSAAYDSFYMHDLLSYVKKYTNAKVILFHCDDYVTFNQYSWSPFYWMNRLVLRFKMRQSIKLADKNYCIIDEQAKVYNKIFNIKFDLLYKVGDFKKKPLDYINNTPLKIVYTGNVVYGRIESLVKIAGVLKEINKKGILIKLYLYTGNIISDKNKKKLLKTNSVEIMGSVDYAEIPKIISNADLLLHVESFEKKEMKTTALSFSTKLVDYFMAGRPILAIGWENSASIKYLNDNEIGVVAQNESDLIIILNDFVKNPKLSNLGKKTWLFGKENHNRNIVLKEFINNLESL